MLNVERVTVDARLLSTFCIGLLSFIFGTPACAPIPCSGWHPVCLGALAGSLPLDRARRLRRDVVDDAIDAAHLVDDAVRHPAEHLVRDRRPVGGNPVE